MSKGEDKKKSKYLLEVTGPGKPEQEAGEQHGRHHGYRQSVLRSSRSAQIVAGGLVLIKEDDSAANHATDTRGQDGELANTDVPVAVLLVDDGVNAEEHVDEGVEEGDIDGDAEGDGVEEDAPGAEQRRAEDRHKGGRAAVGLGGGQDVLEAGDLGGADALRLTSQQHGLVGLGDGEDEYQREGAEYDEDVEAPAPADGQLQEARDDGRERGADLQHDGEEGHGLTTVLVIPDIGHDGRRVGQGGAGEGPRQEAAHEQACEALREGAQEVENDVEDHT